VVQAYVADTSTPEQRVKSLGWLSAVTSLGAVAGPAFGSAMVALGGRHAPGVGAAILSLLVAVFAWRFLRESRVHTTTGGAGHAARSTSRSVMLGILTRWNDPASRLIWIYAIAIGGFYGTIQLAPLLLQTRLHVTEQNVGYFVMYLGGMGVIVRALVLGRAVDRLGEARLSRLGIVLLAAGLLITGRAQGGPAFAAGFTLMPLGTAFLFPCITGLLSRVIPARDRGLYMGVQHTFGGVSRVAFPIGSGILMDRFGVGVPFWIAGLLVLATLPLTVALDRWLAAAPAARSQAVDARNLAAADITGEIRLDQTPGRSG
jgi:MFS family permease